jgi:predicted enzyme related to lactoylglutathione lyase
MPTPPNRPKLGDPGTIAWHELMARDGVAAFDFYAKLFGWTKGPVHDMGSMGPYQMFESEGKMVGGIMTMPPGFPSPFWNYYIQVEGAKDAVTRIQAAGGAVINGPHQVPTGSWIIQARDPQGASFCLVSNTP